MTDFSKFDEYKTTEVEIAKVLKFLHYYDPENETRENAIDFLNFHEALIHEAGHISTDEDMEKLYKKFKSRQH
jgi:hypothetical protein